MKAVFKSHVLLQKCNRKKLIKLLCNEQISELLVAHTSQLSGLGRSVWQQDEFG